MAHPVYDTGITFNLPESVDMDKHVLGVYYEENPDTFDDISTIEASYGEASTSTWVHVPGFEDITRQFSTKVVTTFMVPSREDPSIRKAVVLTATPIDLVGYNLPMLLSSVAGNIMSLPGMYRLGDLIFPKSFVKETFKGPRFGVPGLRELFKAPKRPLALAMVKPKAGLPADVVAKQCYELAMGGVDLIKDDEMTSHSPPRLREERLSKVMTALDKAKDETGKKVVYLVNVTDRVDRVVEIAETCIKEGANGVMVNAWATGLTALQALSEDPSINVPLLGHPAFSGPLQGLSGLDNALLLKLVRLCGADISIFASPWGKFGVNAGPVGALEVNVRSAVALMAPLYDIKPSWPLGGGGLHPGMVQTVADELGYDVVMGGGGGYSGHPKGARAGAKAFMQAIDAVMAGIALEEAAKTNPELKDAIAVWGVHKRPRQAFFDPKKEYLDRRKKMDTTYGTHIADQ